ncbi:hypothetical protein OF83DRAFT_1172409 [Amylostereum chailletii]|nr:hypothetical protein OF83DRAFT_1172409 [Amylostereum chailletii]
MASRPRPGVLLDDYNAIVRLTHVLGGVVLWEFLSTFSYDWDVLRKRRPYLWTIWIHFLCRITCVLSMIFILIHNDISKRSWCRTSSFLFLVFGSASIALASLIVILQIIAIWNRNVVVSPEGRVQGICRFLYYQGAVWLSVAFVVEVPAMVLLLLDLDDPLNLCSFVLSSLLQAPIVLPQIHENIDFIGVSMASAQKPFEDYVPAPAFLDLLRGGSSFRPEGCDYRPISGTGNDSIFSRYMDIGDYKETLFRIAIWNRNIAVSVFSVLAWLASAVLNLRSSFLIRVNTACDVTTNGVFAVNIPITLTADVVLLLLMLVGLVRMPEARAQGICHFMYHQGVVWLSVAFVVEVPAVALVFLNLNGIGN